MVYKQTILNPRACVCKMPVRSMPRCAPC